MAGNGYLKLASGENVEIVVVRRFLKLSPLGSRLAPAETGSLLPDPLAALSAEFGAGRCYRNPLAASFRCGAQRGPCGRPSVLQFLPVARGGTGMFSRAQSLASPRSDISNWRDSLLMGTDQTRS